MKTVKARVHDHRIQLPRKLGLKDGAEVRVLIPESATGPGRTRVRGATRLTPARRRLLERIDARRERIGPIGFSIAQSIREDRDRAR